MRAIVAMARNRIIGFKGKLPWRLPEDLKWFKAMTMGGVLVVGRKTFESVGCLPGRTTLVLTRSVPFDIPDNAWLCGGAEAYRTLLPRCSELFVTEVPLDPEGDTHMPPFEHMFEDAGLVRDDAIRVRRWVR